MVGVPFTFLDVKSNSIQGMMVDAITAAGKSAGFRVDVQQTVFSALIPSLTTQKIDIISAAMLKTPVRQQVVDFSDTVYTFGEGLIVKADDPACARAVLDAPVRAALGRWALGRPEQASFTCAGGEARAVWREVELRVDLLDAAVDAVVAAAHSRGSGP